MGSQLSLIEGAGAGAVADVVVETRRVVAELAVAYTADSRLLSQDETLSTVLGSPEAAAVVLALGLARASLMTLPQLRDAGLTPLAALRWRVVVDMSGRIASDELSLKPGVPFKNSVDVFRHFAAPMRGLKFEQFHVVLLDGKHRFIRSELVSQGTLTSSPVHPREVFGPAIRYSAAAVVLVHNHPSGDASPSADDLEITRRLCEVGSLVGIRVLDHVVVGDNAYASFAERGLLAFTA